MTFNNWENIEVICEGQTEVSFTKKVLNPYLKQYLISLKPIDLGGNISLDRIVKYISRTKTRIVTTFVDYYGFKRVNNLSNVEIIEQINIKSHKNNLIAYLQKHETEALWFSDIETLAITMNANTEQQSLIYQIMREFQTPEDINNSFQTAPSKRLEKIFIGYDKITDGLRIAQDIGIEAMLEKCPGFKNWINTVI